MFLRREKQTFKQRTRDVVSPRKGHSRILQYLLWRIKRRPGTPEFIARGFAIGVAINFWPLFFMHFISGALLCWIFTGDILAMFIGTLLGNPWTFAIVYPIMYKIGKAVLGLRPTHSEASIDSAEEIWSKIWPIHSWDSLWLGINEIILPMMIGGFLLALPCGIISYYIARNAIQVYQTQKRKLLKKQFNTVEAEIEKNNPHVDQE